MEKSNQYQLIHEITLLSSAATWDEAKLEWDLVEVYRQDELQTCLCGHFPILELCVLQNRTNGKHAIVGNVCVKKFIGLPSDKIFCAVKRISSDETKALNAEAVDHAYRSRWITDWEKKFYFDTMRKRNISDKQMAKRIEINHIVLKKVNRNREVNGRTVGRRKNSRLGGFDRV